MRTKESEGFYGFPLNDPVTTGNSQPFVSVLLNGKPVLALGETLMRLFSQMVIPKEVLTDQATNFMSRTLYQVYQLFGITSVRTTPYHPQTDGLVKRFN